VLRNKPTQQKQKLVAKKTSKKKTGKSTSPPPFEESLENLQQTVAQLEGGNLSLSDSLEQYEKGIASLKLAYQALNQVQQRIELLVDLDEEGNLVTRPFDNTASEEIAEGSRRSPRSNLANSGSDEHDIEPDDDDEDVDDPDSLF